MIRFIATAALLSFASTAHAIIDPNLPGAASSPSGWVAGDQTPQFYSARPLWIDANGRFIAMGTRNTTTYVPTVLNFTGGEDLVPECWTVSGTEATRQGLLVDVPGAQTFHWEVAVGVGQEPVVLQFLPRAATGADLLINVYRASCGDGTSTSTFLGQVTTRLGPVPRDDAWPLHDGVVWLVGRIPTENSYLQDQELLRLDLNGTPTLREMGLFDAGYNVRTIGTTPHGTLLVNAGASRRQMLQVTPSGTVTLLNDQLATPPYRLMPAPQLGATIVVGFGSTIDDLTVGLIPEVAPFAFGAQTPPWPLATEIAGNGFVPAADGSIWARSVRNLVIDEDYRGQRFSLRPLSLDGAVADFDRDGLNAAREAAAGTSDLSSDTDGDGIRDGIEIEIFGTDPSRADSRPDLADVPKPVPLAHSLFIDDYGVVVPKPTESYPPLSVVRGPYEYRVDVARNAYPAGVLRVTVANQESTTVVSGADLAPFSELVNPLAYTLGEDAFVMVSPGDERYRGQAVLWKNGTTLKIIDTNRTRCVTVHDAAELAACNAGIRDQVFEGNLRPILALDDMLVVTLGPRILGISASGLRDLADATDLCAGVPIQRITYLGDGGYLGQARLDADHYGSPVGITYGASCYLDRLLRQDGPVADFVGLDPVGPWVVHGYGYDDFMFTKSYMSPYVVGCVDDNCTADFADPQWISENRNHYPAELVPVPKALAPGEVLAASMGTHVTPPPNRGTPPNPIVAYGPSGVESQGGKNVWRLWRVTALGGVTPWLDLQRFLAALDDAGKAALGSTTLGKVTALRVAADGSRVCLVESGRVWELSLADGVLAGIRNLATQGATACAYRGTELAIVADGALRVGGATHAVPPFIDLVRTGEGWLGRTAADAATCVSDDGATHPHSSSMVALGEAPLAGAAGVTYIDGQTNGWIEDTPCAATTRRESTGVSLWSKTQPATTFVKRDPVDGAPIAQRPDGMILLPGETLDLYPETLFNRLRSAYTPSSRATRIEALDPFRRETELRALMSVRLVDVTALATLPGGDPNGDWGQVGPKAPPYVFMDPVDAGPSSDGGLGSTGGTMPPAPKPSSCAGGPGAGLFLAMWLLQRRRAALTRPG